MDSILEAVNEFGGTFIVLLLCAFWPRFVMAICSVIALSVFVRGGI